MELRKCVVCTKPLPEGSRSDKKYCSKGCKTRASEKRRGVKPSFFTPKQKSYTPPSTINNVGVIRGGYNERLELLYHNLRYWEQQLNLAINGTYTLATLGLGIAGYTIAPDLATNKNKRKRKAITKTKSEAEKIQRLAGAIGGAVIGLQIDKERKEAAIANAQFEIQKIKVQIEHTNILIASLEEAKKQKRIQIVGRNLEPVIERTESYSVIKADDLKKLKRKTYKLNDKWKFFLGDEIETNFTALIHGKPKQGKTHLAIQFAQYLHKNFGDVVYFSGEEGAAKTIQDKLERWGAKFPIVYNILGTRGIEEYLKKYNPKFIFIDSLTRLNITGDGVKFFVDEYQDRSWIMITQSTKANSHRGSQELTHFVDSVTNVSNGIATQKGRTVNGETQLPVFEDSQL